MRLGLLVLSIGSFGKKGFYNLQEVGLAKELDKLCEEVKVYKLVSKEQEFVEEKIEGTEHAAITYLPSKSIGTNGIPNLKMLDNTLDAYICFSDTQLMFPAVYKWAEKSRIKLFPYIGVTESHSGNRFKSVIINHFFKRNMKIYIKCSCFVKTPVVYSDLKEMGVENVAVIPVGLDLSLTKQDYEEVETNSLRKKYGYSSKEKIILFVGRMIEEKKPMDMIEIFRRLSNENENYRLIMIGTGELKRNVEAEIIKYELESKVQLYNHIANVDMWEIYCISDYYVNLNNQEIFGMAIMEAMYYGCTVVAVEAPGPNFIIENGVSGYLVKDSLDVVNLLENSSISKEQLKNRIIDKFTWKYSAERIISIIEKETKIS